jgi:hypothetical protein
VQEKNGKISWNDRVKIEVILRRIKEKMDLSHFDRNFLLNHVIERERAERIKFREDEEEDVNSHL